MYCKNIRTIVFWTIFITGFAVTVTAQFPAGFGWVFPRESPPASVSQTVGVTEITIKYHRPSVRDRVIWGCQTEDVIQRPGRVYPCLVPNGQVWRAGANEATTITFSTDVNVEKAPLPAGTYALFMIPRETEWIVIFSKRVNQWGSFTYDQADDALRVKVSPQAAEHLERLEFSFPVVSNNTTQIALHWEKVKVVLGVEVDTAKQASLKAGRHFDPASGYFAADYYYQNKVNLDEALKWINAALAFQENGANFMLKARILVELKRFDEAVEAAGKAVKLYRDRNQLRQAEEAERLIKEWGKSIK